LRKYYMNLLWNAIESISTIKSKMQKKALSSSVKNQERKNKKDGENLVRDIDKNKQEKINLNKN
ncbi:MAG: hypothetical protein NVV82_01120, partial [Sporocytophaga sp.]|nr:hypothetical protein [Sporocytophaga sp.]